MLRKISRTLRTQLLSERPRRIAKLQSPGEGSRISHLESYIRTNPACITYKVMVDRVYAHIHIHTHTHMYIVEQK